MEELTFPAWFEKYRIQDFMCEKAYNEAIPEHKAGIKSAIALHFAQLEKEYSACTEIEKSGFTIQEKTSFIDLALFVVEENFTSPAQLISSVIPALLASAPIGLIFRQAPSSDMLLTLELLGAENIFIISGKEEEQLTKTPQELLEELCENLYNIHEFFTIVNLGRDAKLEKFAKENTIPYHANTKEFVILGGHQKSIFSIAYPNAKIYEKVPKKDRLYLDIISSSVLENNIGNSMIKDNLSNALILGVGCEWYCRPAFSSKDFIISQKEYAFSE